MGGKGGKEQTSGYTYSFAFHMGLCRGPIDELVQIKVGEKIAYTGSLSAFGSIAINQPFLFGGEKSEGGLVGTFHYLPGEAAQTAPSALSTALASGGALVPGFRGVVTAYYDGQISANNPYLKEWKFRIRRTTAGWDDDDPWYPVRAAVLMAQDGFGQYQVKAMNPAHMIYECSTNRVWGRGLPAALIDEESFISAANALCDEGFGLCMRWDRTEAVSKFVQQVIDHIGAALYIDRTTGLLTLKLFRDDYDPEDLPTFDFDSGLLEIEGDDTGSADQNYNEIVVTYHDPQTDEDRQVRAQNVAAIQSVNAIISRQIDFKGVPTPDLAFRLAERELTANANWLKRFKLKLDRRGWKLAPGGVFRISVPTRNIENMVLRVGEIVDGPMSDGTVTVKAVQDVFGLPSTSYIQYTPPAWTPPDRTALPVTIQRISEATYRGLYVALSRADFNTIEDAQCTLATYARSPTGLSQSYGIMSYVDPESYVERGQGDFCPCAFLSAALGLYDTAVTFEEQLDMSIVEVGDGVWIGDELCRVEAIDVDAGTMTIARGCGDTVPDTHEIGEVIWLADGYIGSDFRDYAPAEEVFVKLLTKTTTDKLLEANATEDSVVMAQRFFLPYAPGDFQINGVRYGDVTASVGPAVFTWTHRDRVAQQDQLIDHSETDQGPEAGTTYNIRIYNNALTLVRTETGIVTNTWTYDDTDWAADGSPTMPTIELESERDGLASYMLYRHRFIRTVADPGWDEGYDFNYSGGP